MTQDSVKSTDKLFQMRTVRAGAGQHWPALGLGGEQHGRSAPSLSSVREEKGVTAMRGEKNTRLLRNIDTKSNKCERPQAHDFVYATSFYRGVFRSWSATQKEQVYLTKAE
jgi:hypothetical protein